MKLRDILRQARQGRPDLAAMNLGANRFTPMGLAVLVRYRHSSGSWYSLNELYWCYEEGRQG